MGNIYTISLNNDISKFDFQGEKLFEYSENRLGDLAVLDIQNPLEILLYYPDFQILKILDRTLSEIATLDLTRLNIFQIPTIGASLDGNIWLFDADNQQVLKINRQGKMLFRSNDLRLRFQENWLPNQLIEEDNQVFLQIPEKGIARFDGFGNYQSFYAYSAIENFQVQDGFLLIKEKKLPTQIQKAQLELGITETISLPFPFQKALRYNSRWIILDKNQQLKILNNF